MSYLYDDKSSKKRAAARQNRRERADAPSATLIPGGVQSSVSSKASSKNRNDANKLQLSPSVHSETAETIRTGQINNSSKRAAARNKSRREEASDALPSLLPPRTSTNNAADKSQLIPSVTSEPPGERSTSKQHTTSRAARLDAQRRADAEAMESDVDDGDDESSTAPGAIRVSSHANQDDASDDFDHEDLEASSPDNHATNTTTTNNDPLVVAQLAPDTDQLLEERLAKRDAELQMAQVVAVGDEEEKPSMWWNTKSGLLTLSCLCLVVVAAVAAAVVLSASEVPETVGDAFETNDAPATSNAPTAPDPTENPTVSPNKSTGPPSEPPIAFTAGPTGGPTSPPREWFQLGDEIGIRYSDDEGGAAVAISRNGLAVAVGYPSIFEGQGEVEIHRFRSSGWELQKGNSGASNGEWGGSAFALNGLGSALALNDMGNIVAIGIPVVFHPDEIYWPQTTPPRPGSVEVYRRFDATFTGLDRPVWDDDPVGPGYELIGTAIVGPENNDQFGWSVDLSADGNIVAIGSSNLCYVRVYERNQSTDQWEEQDPGDLAAVCDSTDASFGTSLTLSSSGTTLAVGAPGVAEIEVDANSFADAERGELAVFFYNGESWIARGNKIVGEADRDAFGYALALSDDGMTLAATAPYNQGGADFSTGELQPKNGNCRIFIYDQTEEDWLQRGLNIDGVDQFGRFGASVSLSADGSVVAIGAPGSNVNGDDSGSVSIFEFDPESDDWTNVGMIPGPFPFAYAGTAVALSAEGDLVVVGAPNNAAVSIDRSGDIRIYDSGIIKGGEFPITILMEFFENDWGVERTSATWFLERLDVDRQERVLVSGIDASNFVQFGEMVSTELMVAEGGVYRFVSCCTFLHVTYQIFAGHDGIMLNGTQPYVEGRVTNQAQEHTFQASPSVSNQPPAEGPMRTATLEIHFDSRPEDVHWVIVKDDFVVDFTRIRVKKDNSVVAFGPKDTTYSEDLAGLSLNETIMLPVNGVVTANFKFIFTDTGRDGICCDGGFGSYKLFLEGNNTAAEPELLLSGSGADMRREVHLFSIEP